MEEKKSFGLIVYRFFQFVMIGVWVVLICSVLLRCSGSETEVKAKINNIELESLQYRGVTLFWETGNPMPKEKQEIFFEVMDSLSEDVVEEYSLDRNPVDFFYLTPEEYYLGDLTGGIDLEVGAFQRGPEIFISPLFVDSNNPSIYTTLNIEMSEIYKPNDGDFAMALIHEYMHIIQFRHLGYLTDYTEDVGWRGNSKPKEDENFYRVLSSYSLESPKEDMAETFGYSYLCGNNLDALSEVRLQYIDDFWAIPREEYCRNFH